MHASGKHGYLGSSDYGAYGHSSGAYGFLGSSIIGAAGFDAATGNHGYLGVEECGVWGVAQASQNSGALGTPSYGATGAHSATGNYGYLGSSDYGAYGRHNSSGNWGYLGSSFYAAYGRNNTSGNSGFIGGDSSAVYGVAAVENGYGVAGIANSGTNATGVYGESSSGTAGRFYGKVHVTGNITKGGNCSFKIDHPLDPANKYLAHCAVESPDMKNMYDGTVVLDANGEAWVQLPEWFEALNKDFRYQLTAIGAPGPNLYIAEEISGNAFKIAGGPAGMKVSWQVTGIRQDAWANAHPYQVEEDKPENERGYYQSPESFGQPREMGIASLNRPGEKMR
jgi:hypothetical protein